MQNKTSFLKFERTMAEFELDEERAKKAYDRLVKYLAVSPRSEKECKEKLYEKGYHKNEVEYAIERAKKYRYINDEEYVRTFVLFNKTKYGAKKIEYKLTTEKGIDKRLVANLIEDMLPDSYEIEVASDMAGKYMKQKKIADRSGYQRVSAFLYQRGFSFKIINKVLGQVFDVIVENDEDF